ncbi:translation initiation factor IF-2, partial [Patescibacteria group bacterium]|nr:translation initiation factor IF-2 [Patescibacteria group bacterium]
IDHIKKTGIPVIVALNKIDKKEAQPEKVKGELAKKEVIVESLGGQVPSINLSAKTGQGVDELLEIILLIAEMEELKTLKNAPVSGIVIESNHNKQRGATATLLIKEGVLNNKDIIGTDSACGKIKTMEDFQSNPIKKATVSMPVIITGFNKVPQTGEKFSVLDDLEHAQARIEKHKSKMESSSEKEVFLFEPDKKILNIIIKTDVQGSIEAIKKSLKSIPDDEITLRILKAEAGDIIEADIKLAESAKGRIIGFRVKASSSIQQIARQRKIKVVTFEVIYELVQAVREMLSKLLEPEIIRHPLGKLKVLALFKKEKDRQVIGGKVINGQIKKNALIDVIRNEKKVGQGKIIQLQRDKKEIDEVSKEQECGILFQGTTIIEEKDILEFYKEEKKKREI